ncbi:type IV secretion system DNA-binding domain-containing protein [Robbsia sp. KACC 23696]|uniref:type IV secretion system DNA-binding domain-containing protein n=1 Tax=Robbsia sp. KACC 23696 TaxID=3149231 RepID=UPI00325AD1D9
MRRKIGTESGHAGSPPTLPRRQWSAWAAASSVYGFMAAIAVLILVWRPLLGWSAPSGSLALHASYWGKLGVGLVFPDVFVDDRIAYINYWSSLGAWPWFAVVGRLALAMGSALAPSVFLARHYLSAQDRLIHLRGGRRYVGRVALKELNRKLKSRVRRHADHPIAPGVVFPADLWTRHVLIVGGVGAGKSTLLRPLINTIIRADELLFLFDPKGEFTSSFTKPVLIAPWDKRSYAWDIGRDLRNSADMTRFAAATIADSHDPLWSNASRQILVGLMLYLQGTMGTGWGWQDLADAIRLPQKQLLVIMKQWHPVAIRAVEEASITTTGILINLGAFCSPIFDLAAAWGHLPQERRVSLVDWISEKARHRQLLVQGHGSYSELTKSYVAAMVETISGVVNSVEMSDSFTRKVWFVADEFPKMGRIPVLPLFEVGRSRGVRCVVACQDFGQLEELHGEKAVRALLAMCGTLVVGQMMSGKTAKEICEVLGMREVERPSSGQGGGSRSTTSGGAVGTSYSRDEMQMYHPSEFASRLGPTPDQRGVRMIVFTQGDAHELVWPHFPMPVRRRAHVPAQWTIGALAGPQSLPPNGPSGESLAHRGHGIDSPGDDADAARVAVLNEWLGRPALRSNGKPIHSSDQ